MLTFGKEIFLSYGYVVLTTAVLTVKLKTLRAFIRTRDSEPPAIIRDPAFIRSLASSPRRLLHVIIPSIQYVNVYSFVIID